MFGYRSDVSIRTDSEGRYCLNDLHKAAGGEKTHQPSNFFRLDSTNGLIDELDNSSDMRNIAVVTIPGRNGGTYALIEEIGSSANLQAPLSDFGDCPVDGAARFLLVGVGLLKTEDTPFAMQGAARLMPKDSPGS